jgi:hypothetical protein
MRGHPGAQDRIRPGGDADLDEKEDISVGEIALAKVPALLGGGAITHALVAVAFQKLDLHRRGLLRIG